MVTIKLSREINAPIERCFDLSRSIDLHTASTSKTNEKAIAGRISGLIGNNETVTWRAKHFGVYQKLTIKIIEVKPPFYFKDVMLKGAFKVFEHEHFFGQKNATTIMEDILVFRAPFGFLGSIAEKLFLKNYLRKFLLVRNEMIRQVAESDEWKKFVRDS